MFKVDLFNLLRLTLHDESIKGKIIYGSDFYMVEQQTSERQFVTNIRAYIVDIDFKLIAELNPRLFLLNVVK